MNKTIKRVIIKLIIYMAVFSFSLFLMCACLFFSARIGRDSIRGNMEKSAAYLLNGEMFFCLLDGIDGSKEDRYADSILLNIAWNLDQGDTLESIMRTSYYFSDNRGENSNLFDSVEKGYGPNQEYLRYWHGSAAVVRFLHLFLSLKEIYILNGILMVLLAAALFMVLIRNSLTIPAISLAVSLAAVSVWFVPFCLEYAWTFLLMFIFSLITVMLELKEKTLYLGVVFLLSGMVTNYLDFLTTETLTLLIPLILALYIRLMLKNRPFNEGRNLLVEGTASWGAGYVFAWISKWALASLVLKENALPYVTGHVQERMNNTYGLSPFHVAAGAVTKNIACLFPFSYGTLGFLAGIGVLIFLAYYLFVYGKKNNRKEALLLMIIAGLLPYVRYLLLRNHSFIHFFFTYRAQAATVFALVILILIQR